MYFAVYQFLFVKFAWIGPKRPAIFSFFLLDKKVLEC